MRKQTQGRWLIERQPFRHCLRFKFQRRARREETSFEFNFFSNRCSKATSNNTKRNGPLRVCGCDVSKGISKCEVFCKQQTSGFHAGPESRLHAWQFWFSITLVEEKSDFAQLSNTLFPMLRIDAELGSVPPESFKPRHVKENRCATSGSVIALRIGLLTPFSIYEFSNKLATPEIE